MGKESTGIKIFIGGTGYSLSRGGGNSGYSLSRGGGYSSIGTSKGYSMTGSGKGYGSAGRLDSSRIGYSSMAAGGYANAGMKMKGYSVRQSLYGSVSLFPVPYRRMKDELTERLKSYRKKCPMCGNESMSSGYSFN